jgi:hypothetical protein
MADENYCKKLFIIDTGKVAAVRPVQLNPFKNNIYYYMKLLYNGTAYFLLHNKKSSQYDCFCALFSTDDIRITNEWLLSMVKDCCAIRCHDTYS